MMIIPVFAASSRTERRLNRSDYCRGEPLLDGEGRSSGSLRRRHALYVDDAAHFGDKKEQANCICFFSKSTRKGKGIITPKPKQGSCRFQMQDHYWVLLLDDDYFKSHTKKWNGKRKVLTNSLASICDAPTVATGRYASLGANETASTCGTRRYCVVNKVNIFYLCFMFRFIIVYHFHFGHHLTTGYYVCLLHSVTRFDLFCVPSCLFSFFKSFSPNDWRK